MSPIFSRHPRGELSAYVDGQLPPGRRDAITAHLSTCEACRSEIAELRSLREALSALPEVASRRSFALTPEQVAGPLPIAPERPYVGMPLANGLKMAAAGLGVALIAVVLVDAGGSGENSSDDDAAMRIESEDADFAGGEFQSAPEGAPDDAAAESGETTAAIGIPEERGAGTPDGEDAERSSADADADEGGGEEAGTTMSLQASALISEPIVDASDLPAVAPGPTLDADSYIVPTPNTKVSSLNPTASEA